MTECVDFYASEHAMRDIRTSPVGLSGAASQEAQEILRDIMLRPDFATEEGIIAYIRSSTNKADPGIAINTSHRIVGTYPIELYQD